jgi:hypothetical protein
VNLLLFAKLQSVQKIITKVQKIITKRAFIYKTNVFLLCYDFFTKLIVSTRKERKMIDRETAAVKSDMDRILLSLDEKTGIFDILNRIAEIIDQQNQELKRMSEALDKIDKIK